jgi:hypothetical protein
VYSIQAPVFYKMNRSHLVFLTLLCILAVQLVSLDVHVPIERHAIGELQHKPEKATRLRPTPEPTSVLYTAQKESFGSLIFTGDVLLARNVEYLMNLHGSDYPFSGLSFSTIAKSPAVVGNFEASVPIEHIYTPALQMRFSVSPVFLEAIQENGFTHLSQANNHALDYGQSGFLNAREHLKTQQVETFGHPNTLDTDSIEFVKVGDKTVAVIAAYTLITLPTYSELRDVFAYANSRSDYQVVYVHWGDEYVLTHNKRQKEAAQRFVEAGADIIVGHHPHVVQDIQLVDGVPVFYSLGNYVFDQYDSVSTQEGLMLHLELKEAGLAISLVPVTSVGTLSQPRFMSQANHGQFLRDLSNRSDKSLREQIRSGLMLLDEQVASSSKVAIMSQ